MSDAVQIVARGSRAEAEAAAAAIDSDVELEGATYSIIEEDEDRAVWRIDAFPTSLGEADALRAALAKFGGLAVATEKIADADWLAMALSGLPPIRAGRFFVFGVHDRGRAPVNAVKLRIEAGAAFGTGHHGTTVGCLLAFDQLLKSRRFAQGSRRRRRHRPAGHSRGADRVARGGRHGHRSDLGAHLQRQREDQPGQGAVRLCRRPDPPSDPSGRAVRSSLRQHPGSTAGAPCPADRGRACGPAATPSSPVCSTASRAKCSPPIDRAGFA